MSLSTGGAIRKVWERSLYGQRMGRIFQPNTETSLQAASYSGKTFGPSVFLPFSISGFPEPLCLCASDGLRVFWNFPFLSSMAKGCSEEKLSLMEAFLLHQVIHCLFGHPFSIPPACPPQIWSLSCDITAWHILEVWIPELLPENFHQWLKTISENFPEVPLYQARLLSSCLKSVPPGDPVFTAPGKFPFSDSHDLWPILQKGNPSAKPWGTKGGSENSSGKGIPSSKMAEAESTACHWKKLQKQLTGTDAPLSPTRQEKKRRGNPGRNPGGMRRPLSLTDTRRHDYRSLLKSLSGWGEEMKINDHEFSYAPYLFGLEHYDGIPLMEPLEYAESEKIRELAIVIDTSASCSHALTQAFLEETRNLILEEELFFCPFNLHILQCDTKVERDDKLTSLEDLKDYIDHLEIYGMGGTDFGPAFSYIENLQRSGEFSELSAVLFFTDGAGIFPAKPPGVKTVFIFLDGQYDDIDVPEWAEILVLNAKTERTVP